MDFLYHPMARDPNSAGRFADVISRAKDELVTPAEFAAYAQGKREAFDISHDPGFDAVIAELRERDALGTLWQGPGGRGGVFKKGGGGGGQNARRGGGGGIGGAGGGPP